MSDWENLDEVGEEWWDNAYKLFLESDPITMILRHVAYYISFDNWNDYGFRRNTRVPPTGEFCGVSKKAILVVISRARRMEYGNWKKLHGTRSEPEDLHQRDKDVINWITAQIYNEHGSPKPLNK